MNILKKFIASILSVAILSSLLSINSFALTEHILSYELSSDGNSYICNGIKEYGNNPNITIPSTYNGKPVSEIKQMAFMSQSNITNITVSTGIKKLGMGCFADVKDLTSVTLPSSLTDIEKEIFVYCDKLSSVNLQDGIPYISYSMFYGCGSLTNITIPSSVTTVGESAFVECYALKTVSINGAKNIGNSAFEYCNNLTNVTLPNNLVNIGNSAFSGCENLTDITIPNTVTTIEDNAFNKCSSLTNIVLPHGVSNIGFHAFQNCTNLKSLTIPSSVTFFGEEPFSNCNFLNKVLYAGTLSQWNNITVSDTKTKPFLSSKNIQYSCFVPTMSSVTGNISNWQTKSVTLTANGINSVEGGLHEKPYSFSTQQGVYNWQTENTATFDTNQTVYVYLRDKVGNVALRNTTVINKIDTTAPTITNITGNPTDWTNSNVTLTVNGAVDKQSGLHETPYSFSTEQGVYNWQSENTATFDTNQTVYIYVKDKAGNILLADTQTINKIDKIVPTITDVTGNPTDWTNKDITLTVNGAVD
ncbi:MAG: leucine-rich repeat domain-containing protein, partial [Oscillospiraceae bacterium]